MTNEEPTRAAPDPSDSLLLTLARAAMGPDNTSGDATWPHLDLDDPAQRQFGDYELLEEIDRGGMGVVYRAHQASLDREVAIKFIAAGLADTLNVTRFLAEARAAARLLHPNIVPVYEVGSLDGVHYFSMPLIKGRTLANVLQTGTLGADAAIKLSLTLCDALDYAHRLGLLHLDLKPANILLDERNEPLIADFGLARHVDEQGGVDAQEVSGTPSFMAPEQILIKQYRLTRATDIYALGAILYRCLSGVSPHGDGKPDEVIRRAAAGRVRPPRSVNPKIPRDLDAICMKCLELQPADRYASAAQLADDLRRARDGLPVSVRRVGFAERVQRWVKREPRFAAAITAAVLALLVGIAGTAWQWRQTMAQRDRAQIAGEIGAHLFAYEGADDKRAADLIAWLRKRLPGDEMRQAEALTQFASSVDGVSRDQTEGLLMNVVQELGTNYRSSMIQSLEAGSNPDKHLYAAVLAYSDAHDPDRSARFATYLKAAIEARPKDPLVWHVAAVYCPQDKCLYPSAAERLQRLDPDNMYPWLLQLSLSGAESTMRTVLHRAAQRSRFDDYSLASFASYSQAIDAAGVRAPPLIRRPVQLLAPGERPESIIAYLSAGVFPIAPYETLARFCGASGGAAKVVDPQVQADCLTIGTHMMRADAHATIVAQMIGVALVRAAAPDTTLAAEALQKRRLYRYAAYSSERLSPRQQMSYSAVRYLRDLSTVGELEADRRRLAFFKVPDRPPPDWQPANPLDLVTSREREQRITALARDTRRLLAQGKFAELVARVVPLGDAVRARLMTGDLQLWRAAEILKALGQAQLALGQYEAANSNLVDAVMAYRSFGPPYRNDARDAAQALIALHSALARSEPHTGHEVAIRKWQQVLAALDTDSDDGAR